MPSEWRVPKKLGIGAYGQMKRVVRVSLNIHHVASCTDVLWSALESPPLGALVTTTGDGELIALVGNSFSKMVPGTRRPYWAALSLGWLRVSQDDYEANEKQKETHKAEKIAQADG